MGKSHPIPPTLTPKDIVRFWGYVNKDQGQGPDGDCWEWAKGKSAGYGSFGVGGRVEHRTVSAHRLSFFLTYKIWSLVNICHRCDNPPCVNPDHLFEGDDKINLNDARAKGRIPWGWQGPTADNRGDRNGTRKHPECIVRGSKRKGSRLTEQDIPTIRRLYAETAISLRALAAKYQVDHGTIRAVIKRKTWVHV